MNNERWRMTIMTAILKIHSNPDMHRFILLFYGYSVQVVGACYPRKAVNDA